MPNIAKKARAQYMSTIWLRADILSSVADMSSSFVPVAFTTRPEQSVGCSGQTHVRDDCCAGVIRYHIVCRLRASTCNRIDAARATDGLPHDSSGLRVWHEDWADIHVHAIARHQV